MSYNSVFLVNHDSSDKLSHSPRTVMSILKGHADLADRRNLAKIYDEVEIPEHTIKCLPPAHSSEDMFIKVGGNSLTRLRLVSEFSTDGKKHMILVEEDS